MNRRSFLSTLALLPGLEWLKPRPMNPLIDEMHQHFDRALFLTLSKPKMTPDERMDYVFTRWNGALRKMDD